MNLRLYGFSGIVAILVNLLCHAYGLHVKGNPQVTAYLGNLHGSHGMNKQAILRSIFLWTKLGLYPMTFLSAHLIRGSPPLPYPRYSLNPLLPVFAFQGYPFNNFSWDDLISFLSNLPTLVRGMVSTKMNLSGIHHFSILPSSKNWVM